MKQFALTRLRLLLLVASTLFLSSSASASHILGGDIGYTHISDSTYKVTLTLFSDCNAYATQNLIAGRPVYYLYDGNTYVAADSLTYDSTLSNIEVTTSCTTPAVTQCTNPSSVIPGMRKFVFSGIRVLPHNSTNWRIIFAGQSNNSFAMNPSYAITNIFISSDFSVRYEATLNSMLNNSTPVQSTGWQPYYCINTTGLFINTDTDVDADSIVYTLIPATSAYIGTIATASSFSYVSPYTGTNPMAASAFSYNMHTGSLSFYPTQIQRALMEFQVSEYRGGILVGTSQRQMTIAVLPCTDPCTAAVGINEPIAGQSIKVYPNPANDLLHIETTGQEYDHATITNALGQVLMYQPISAQHTALSITALPAGVYFVRLSGNNLQEIRMITVIR